MADSPDYIAFRVPEGRGLPTVVAMVQPADLAGSCWAVWYSVLTPLEKPLNYNRLGIDSRIAKIMIEVINSGGSLPADFVEQLPVVKLGLDGVR